MRDASLAWLPVVSVMLAAQARELESLDAEVKEAEASLDKSSFAKQLNLRSDYHTTERPVIIVTVTPDDVERGTVTQTRGTVTFTHLVTTTTTTTTVTTVESFDSMMMSSKSSNNSFKSLSGDGAWMWLCFAILAAFWIFIITCCCCMNTSKKPKKKKRGVDGKSLKRDAQLSAATDRDVQITSAAPSWEASPLLSHTTSHTPSVPESLSSAAREASPLLLAPSHTPSVPELPPTPLMDLLAPRGSYPSKASFSGARSPNVDLAYPMTSSFAQNQPAAASGYHVPVASSASFPATSASPSYTTSASPSYTSPLATTQQSMQYSGRLNSHHLTSAPY